ncbi:major facilitator superfamily MFS_1 [Beutenbergia cavernae DSM 12333]|uniref:Major facilitator superfamily MFS_1 n=1 Tax=Beutenbergia cavernae (strain ATCC BAA-8 / DSM 12333 / CCUG 43141 / JCM 11478 / NBRC 16432 / NCIMB 13614 / HKI 0122) TaxID=471853 RepID=C5BVC2_BEUC1|nr:MFS transporter [Beutenbergia cavernae]ACQ80509.1 major facilitator superfamily MFS_1 [Beutenbergia cavernae DSM 12333]
MRVDDGGAGGGGAGHDPGPPGGPARLPRGLTVAFGLVVVVAFGSWFYGYGVLVEPIVRETGWSESALSSAYGIGLLGVGVGAVVAGRVVDRWGGRPVFLGGAAGTLVGTVVVALAPSAPVFVVAAVLTQTCVGGAGYYAAVHATISRLVPAARVRAITTNTLWGAFASPVFLPLVAWLVLGVGWRAAIAIVGATVVAAFALAAALVPPMPPASPSPRSLAGDLAHAVRSPLTRRLLVVALCGGAASSVMFLYQVPAMVTAGLALGTASALAGLRGLFQLAGRLPLPWAVRRVGARPLFRASIAAMGVGSLLLLASGNLVVALTFAVVVGTAVGALTTLESIYAAEIVTASMLGTVLGAYSLVRGIGSALGPVGAGLVTEATGGRALALVVVAVIAVVGAVAVPPPAPRPEQPAGRPGPAGA